MIPQRLGVPRGEVAYVDVTLTSDHLRDLTVIDTPGLASANRSVSAQAPSGSCSTSTAPIDDDLDDDSAGALVRRRGDHLRLHPVGPRRRRGRPWRRSGRSRPGWPATRSTPLGLFNKVDKLVGGGADPWPVAGPLAADQAAGAAPGRLRRRAGRRAARRDHRGRPAHRRRLRGAAAARRSCRPTENGRPARLRRPVHQPRRARCRGRRGSGCCACSTCTASASPWPSSPPSPQLATGELVRLLLAASGFPRLRQTLDQAFRVAHRRDQGRLGTVQPGEDRQPRRAAARPGTAARRDRTGAAAPRVPPAAAAGGRPTGHHRRRRAARDDGAAS